MLKNHKSFLGCLLLSALTATGCSSMSGRNPSSDEAATLAEIIEDISDASAKIRQDPLACKVRYDLAYTKLFNLAGDPTLAELADLKEIDHQINASFSARLALKETLKAFESDSECLRSATDVFRGLRYVEDYLIEMRMEKAANAPSEYVSMTGEFPYLLVNPKYASEFKSYEDLQSGDVILSRGNAFSSAAIARIGINDYQFSHLSFVYKNPETKELYTTEAHIEIGSVVEPLIEHVSAKSARSVVFRYNDSQISSHASQLIHDRVLKNQLEKKNIQYDFSMDFKDNERLFCSEVISSGFKAAVPDSDYIPKFKSKFSPGIIPFLNTIGVPATKENVATLEVFAPGDIQFDPRFEMVAEWRNPRKMEESRMKDFILTKIFERMDKGGYKFDPSLKMDVESRTFWLLRRLPVVRKFIQNKFPLNMSPSQLELFMALDKVGDAIYKEMEKASLEYERPMTPKEILGVLDKFFSEDFEHYKRYKKGQDVGKPLFHQLFHP